MNRAVLLMGLLAPIALLGCGKPSEVPAAAAPVATQAAATPPLPGVSHAPFLPRVGHARMCDPPRVASAGGRGGRQHPIQGGGSAHAIAQPGDLDRQLAELQSDADLQKVSDYQAMAAAGVMATPAVAIDGVIKLADLLDEAEEVAAHMSTSPEVIGFTGGEPSAGGFFPSC